MQELSESYIERRDMMYLVTFIQTCPILFLIGCPIVTFFQNWRFLWTAVFAYAKPCHKNNITLTEKP